MLDYNDSVFNHIKMDEANKEKFLSVYGIADDSEDFSFSMVLSEDKWANLDDTYSDEGLFPVSDLDSGITFQTGGIPITVYQKMASDGIEFDFSWNSVSLNNEASFGKGEARNGKLVYATDLGQIEEECEIMCGDELDEKWLENRNLEPRWITDDFIDQYGNCGYFDGDDFIIRSTSLFGEEMFAYDVRAELDGDAEAIEFQRLGLFYIGKVPVMYAKWWKENKEDEIARDDYDCLFVNYDGDKLFLVDKDGNRVKSLSDADHSEFDACYIVPKSDFIDGDRDRGLTEDAKAKWRKRLG